MNTKVWRWLVICTVAVAMVAAAVIAVKLIPDRATVRPVNLNDERAAAENLLAAKLSGPRYFNVSPDVQPEGGVLWIDVDDALFQVPRIVAKRKLGAEAEKSVRQLIEKLSVSHPYRMVGGKRINLSRLNLSLDSIK